MKKLSAPVMGIFLLLNCCQGDTVDPNQIQQFLQRVDESMIRANIYHIKYNVLEKNTDAFYAHKKALIKLLEDAMAQEQTTTPPAQQDKAFAEKQDGYQNVIRQCKKALTNSREQTLFFDYSLDGTGFYLELSMTFVGIDGKAGSRPASITVSDGKMMGSFYPDQSQAVIQPATERPQVGTTQWPDTAYLFRQRTLPMCISSYPLQSMKEEAGEFVITADKPMEQKEHAHTELRIDKATLLPQSATFFYYNQKGALHQKLTRTWTYQNVAGITVPKIVTDQEYRSVLSEPPELEKEQMFTVTQWNPIPLNAKAEFAKLLKGNWSVFDEVTGTHYLSGNPGGTLDELSK